LTTDQVDTLHDVIVAETVAKIAEFLQSEEADQISHWAKYWSARSSFSYEVGKQVDITIRTCFHIVPKNSATAFLRWTWSLISRSPPV
jgi:hypothetical protein